MPPRSSAIPRTAKLFDARHARVRDPAELLVRAACSDEQWPALVIVRQGAVKDRWGDPIPPASREQEHVAGVDFELLARLPASLCTGGWYWPTSKLSHFFDTHQPRYQDLRDALVASVKLNGDAAYVMAMHRRDARSGLHGCGIRVRAWFDNPDYGVRDGAVEVWWRAWFAQAPVAAPVPWAGSDEWF